MRWKSRGVVGRFVFIVGFLVVFFFVGCFFGGGGGGGGGGGKGGAEPSGVRVVL